MRKIGLFFFFVGLFGYALFAGTVLMNDSDDAARGVRIIFSAPVEITTVGGAFTEWSPAETGTEFILSGGVAKPWDSVWLNWTPKGADLISVEWLKEVSSAPHVGPEGGPDAAVPPWEQTNGPTGGIINAIEIDPDAPDTLYAGGAGGAVFRSEDGGETWTMLSQIVPPSVQIGNIVLLPGSVIVCAAGCLYRSDDGGEVWNELDQLRPFTCIAGALTDRGPLMAAGARGGVYISDDLGETWKDVGRGLPNEEIAVIAVGPDGTIWAGTRNGGRGAVYRSVRGGAWRRLSLPSQPDADIQSIAVDPDDPRTVYIGRVDVYNVMFNPHSDRYLLKTEDGGATWQELYLPGTDAMVNVMPIPPGGGAIYVGTGGVVYKSENGGATWVRIGPPGRNGDMYDIAVDPRDPRTLYLPRRAYGIVKSTDGGMTWTEINTGLNNVSVSLLAVPNNPGSETVYATAVSGEGTFKTTDGGETWKNVLAGGITHPWADELRVNPLDDSDVWEVADVAKVYRSSDYGEKWEKIIDPDGPGFRFGSVYALAPAPSDPDIIYALKNGFGIFRSRDGGNSWSFLHRSEVDYTYTLAVHPRNPDIVFSGYNPKPFQHWAMIRRSTDGGETWNTVLQVPDSKGITSVVFAPSDPRIMYAASRGPRGEVFVSRDGGNSWNVLNEHFTMCTVWGQSQLILDPDRPATAYIGTWLGGTWRTRDAGEHWDLLEQAPRSSTALSMDPTDKDTIYAADRSAPKVWRTRDGGDSWEEVADFSKDGALLVMRVAAFGGTVYASTFEPFLHGGRLYKSTDRGDHWTDITGSLGKGILDIAIDPTDPNRIFVTTNINGAYRSLDGGKTWTRLEGFPDVGAYDIEIDPNDPSSLYIAARGGSLPAWFTRIAGDRPEGVTFSDPAGVYRSQDGGETWTQLLTTSASCRAIRIHPQHDNVLLAVDILDGVYVSVDGGKTWNKQNAGLDTTAVTSCRVSGDQVYVGTQGCGVYSGRIDPATGRIIWRKDRSNKPVPPVYSVQVEVDPHDPNRIYVGANPGGLFCSSDGGKTFRDRNGITPSVIVDDPYHQGYYTFDISPTDPDVIWLGTWGKGIFKSYDGMLLDVPASGEDMMMLGKHVYQILVYPLDPETAYVAAEEGVYRTTDGGRTWEDLTSGLDTPQVRTIALTADRRLLAGTLGYEIYSRPVFGNRWRQLPAFGNFGTFWPIWNDRPLYQYTSLLFDPDDPNTIFFGTFPAGIYKSTDGGKSWRERNVGWTDDGVFSLVTHPTNSKCIYAGTYNGVNRTLDGGAHWERWDNGWPGEQWVFSIAFDPRDPNIMYACSKNGENEGTGRDGFHGTVMKTTDGGAHWFPITDGLDLDQEFYKVIVDPNDPDIVYLATQFDGVYVSLDQGAHWQPWNSGLFNPQAGTNGNNVTNTMVITADGRWLYFGSAGSGVFKRKALGAAGE